MILPILQYPDPKLLELSKEVTKFDDKLAELIANMVETCEATPNCVGLAAIQIGLPMRLSVIKNGKKESVEPLSGRGFMNFPGVGKLEYFLTDGLGSLPHSFPKVRDMFEYTLRYPGHAEMMN
ncbi:MAG: peptide deformylase, partial [Patescibacteria group bacterium]|nr:peptide deformylase [Patescibacteria group bacterium]